MSKTYKINLKILLTCLACVIISSLKAQDNNSIVYPVVIEFHSMGTGVPSDSALRSYINSFKKKNKIKQIAALHIGPMGKEGEYWLAFSLKELTKKQVGIFSSQLKVVAEKPTTRGSTVFLENAKIDNKELPGRATAIKVIL